MDLKRLRYFCAIVEHGSITKASKMLHMAQPPLSKRLQELEDEVGTQLIVRSGPHMGPTSAGIFLYHRTSDILRQLDDTLHELQAMTDVEPQVLRIGLTHLYQHHFSDFMMEVHRLNENLSISVKVSDSSQLESLLRDGAIDIALIQRPQNMSGFDCIDMPTIDPVLVAPDTLGLFPEADEVSLTDLDSVPLVLLRRTEGKGTYEALLDALRKVGLNPRPLISISQPEVILDWLENELDAVAILPSSEVRPNDLHRCSVFQIEDGPSIFNPVILKLHTTSFSREIADVLTMAENWSAHLF